LNPPTVIPASAGAIIVAAGSSRRMGFDKLAAPLRGATVLAHSVRAFERCAAIRDIVLVGRPGALEPLGTLARTEGWRKIAAIVPGGAERHESVALGLGALPPDNDIVAVHDAARPLVTPEAIARCLEAARDADGASLATPVADTLKRAEDGWVTGSVDRANLWAMATPQAFPARILREAYRRLAADGATATDEVSAVERIGGRIRLVDPRGPIFKITRPEDLALAELALAARDPIQP
jgi:2-C-methyl-D-erythritol 4-phosphate cytidylyltransferase